MKITLDHFNRAEPVVLMNITHLYKFLDGEGNCWISAENKYKTYQVKVNQITSLLIEDKQETDVIDNSSLTLESCACK